MDVIATLGSLLAPPTTKASPPIAQAVQRSSCGTSPTPIVTPPVATTPTRSCLDTWRLQANAKFPPSIHFLRKFLRKKLLLPRP